MIMYNQKQNHHSTQMDFHVQLQQQSDINLVDNSSETKKEILDNSIFCSFMFLFLSYGAMVLAFQNALRPRSFRFSS